jgi:hypothetical protein
MSWNKNHIDPVTECTVIGCKTVAIKHKSLCERHKCDAYRCRNKVVTLEREYAIFVLSIVKADLSIDGDTIGIIRDLVINNQTSKRTCLKHVPCTLCKVGSGDHYESVHCGFNKCRKRPIRGTIRCNAHKRFDANGIKRIEC